MQFSLRTLVIVMLLGGPALAGAWWLFKALPYALVGVGIGIAISSVTLAWAWSVQRSENALAKQRDEPRS